MGFVQVRIMDHSHIKRKVVVTLSLCFLGIIILSFTGIPYHNFIFAASDFTIEAKINLQKLNDPAKMKVV
ncbi:MAG TPA: hypothetical protein VE594_00840, partial [Nitrososphaeraceae archaeon]|nr:hypothetical protein [Nitrososphaeraceae archaeon]